ncbi:hypothetical protein SUGI_0049390 [Cryptomeria japonica]|uniref:histone H2B.8-like n=1 Tax=Cryptomeria japonica TaxID=3369 RepID=UPI002408A54F|nr:histone H2B.8-like [Cryptomeria japonica]GLJ06826.1 hypothetical protein SUGI_0049390 [Cryptomeria japonica]
MNCFSCVENLWRSLSLHLPTSIELNLIQQLLHFLSANLEMPPKKKQTVSKKTTKKELAEASVQNEATTMENPQEDPDLLTPPPKKSSIENEEQFQSDEEEENPNEPDDPDPQQQHEDGDEEEEYSKRASTMSKSSVTDEEEKNKKKSRGGAKKKRKGKRNADSYKIYLYKVLKQVHPEAGISSRAMGVMNSFMNDIFERLANESAKLSQYNKKNTLSSREIQSAARLVLPGELAKHAVSEGTKAVTKFMQN